VRRTGLRRINPCRSRAAWRAPPLSSRTRVGCSASHSGEICLYSIIVGFGVVTLFATGFLFVMHMLEDFRDA
jgi:hypothetical protein